ncbi:MAG: response regulator transcription factor [Armatimonadetes bacterium]|nr:response regulator transcription factor [Armatimonadota bacterium]
MSTSRKSREEMGIYLTGRELEVLKEVCRGLSNQEVADKLCISRRTVDFHLLNIYDKLNVSSRMQALRQAMLMGLFSMEPASEKKAAPVKAML